MQEALEGGSMELEQFPMDLEPRLSESLLEEWGFPPPTEEHGSADRILSGRCSPALSHGSLDRMSVGSADSACSLG